MIEQLREDLAFNRQKVGSVLSAKQNSFNIPKFRYPTFC